MSEGRFEYREFYMEDIANDLENLIETNNTKNEWGCANDCILRDLERFDSSSEDDKDALKIKCRTILNQHNKQYRFIEFGRIYLCDCPMCRKAIEVFGEGSCCAWYFDERIN